MRSTMVIAEPGSTHEGNLLLMCELMKAAADAGADCFKNQWVSHAQKLCDRRHAPEYLESYRKLAYPFEWHESLRQYAHQLKLEYACTFYLPGDGRALCKVVDYLKVSSFEAQDGCLLHEALSCSRPVMMSLGMMDGPTALRLTSRLRPADTALHCVSAYPTPIDETNLAFLRQLAFTERPFRVGFSDHTRQVQMGAWAVCAGAEALEVHLRLDRTSPDNRDFAVAFTPCELESYIRGVRMAETALGSWVKGVQSCEAAMLRYRVECGPGAGKTEHE